MRWQVKAGIQKLVSFAPRSEQVNYLLQRANGSFPTSDEQIRLHFGQASKHVAMYEDHTGREAADASVYEFGAGWDLIGAVSMWMLGSDRQTLVDLEPHVRWELVQHTLERLSLLHEELEHAAARPLRRLDTTPITSHAELESRLGISYHAPRDARATGLGAGRYDLITSTFTLEHVPAHDIAAILRECAHLLGPGGVVSSSIDLQDHYSFADPRISIYNFLRYSDRSWRFVNSPLHFQNRLRVRDYLALFGGAGLNVIEADAEHPTDQQRQALDELPLYDRFRRDYTLDELALKALHVVAVVD